MLLEQLNPCLSCATSVTTFIVCNTLSPRKTKAFLSSSNHVQMPLILPIFQAKIYSNECSLLNTYFSGIFCTLGIRFHLQHMQTSHLHRKHNCCVLQVETEALTYTLANELVRIVTHAERTGRKGVIS